MTANETNVYQTEYDANTYSQQNGPPQRGKTILTWKMWNN